MNHDCEQITDMLELRLPADRDTITEVLKGEYVNLALQGFIAGIQCIL